MAKAEPKNIRELLDFLKEFVVRQYQESGNYTSGAALADAVRHEYPGFSYEQLGLERLSDAVARAEADGLLSRNRSVAHLEVSPGPATGIDVPAEEGGTTERCQIFLRPEIWSAFVFVTSQARHSLDRVTGRVKPVQPDDGETTRDHDSNLRYVAIPKISAEEQRSWMRAFVEDADGLVVDDAPILTEQWWVEFPRWLREQDPVLEKAWSRERTRRVVDAARIWAKTNNIPLNMLLALPKRTPSKVPRVSEDTDTVRQAILAALGEMQLHELENLSIPVRYIIRHLHAS